MSFDGNGYDPVTGQNSGNLNFQSLQGYVNNQPYYAPAPFNPAAIGGNPNDQQGYINFGSAYNPVTNPSDYTYSPFYYDTAGAGNSIVYGSGQTNQLTPQQSAPTINGQYEGTYAQQYSKGIGSPNPSFNSRSGGYSVTDPGKSQGSQVSPIVPYNQYTEPGYTPPQYSSASPSGTQSFNSQGQSISNSDATPASFMFGNNGSDGIMSGVFSNNTPGQSSAFYQNQPTSQSKTNPALGVLTPWSNPTTTPVNPALQALTQSRS